MHIGYTGPISLKPLSKYVDQSDDIPNGYLFPLGASIVEEYIKQGNRVSIFTLDKNIKKSRCFKGEKLCIYVGPMRSPAVLRLIDFFNLEIGYIRKTIAESNCDVVHAMWSYEFAQAAMAAHRKVLVTAHDAPGVVLKYMPELFRMARYMITVNIVRRADYMTAVSPYISDYYLEKLRYKGYMAIVPNGLDRELLSDHPKQFSSEGNFKILCNSNWGYLKNVKAALRGFHLAQLRNPRIKLILCGNNLGLGEKAHDWARRRGLCCNVEFLGTVDFYRLQQLIADEIDICLHTSREESFSMAIAECMAKGIPCIGGRSTGAVPWLLDGGQAGELVDVENVDEIMEALLKLTIDADHYNVLASAAHKRVMKNFMIEKIATAYLAELYRTYRAD